MYIPLMIIIIFLVLFIFSSVIKSTNKNNHSLYLNYEIYSDAYLKKLINNEYVRHLALDIDALKTDSSVKWPSKSMQITKRNYIELLKNPKVCLRNEHGEEINILNEELIVNRISVLLGAGTSSALFSD